MERELYLNFLKDTIKKKKRQDSEWEKRFAVHNQRGITTDTREDLCLEYVKKESMSKRHTALQKNGQMM